MNLIQGLKCKACDAPLYEADDNELCRTCITVVFDYNKDLWDKDDLEFDEWLDTNLMTEE